MKWPKPQEINSGLQSETGEQLLDLKTILKSQNMRAQAALEGRGRILMGRRVIALVAEGTFSDTWACVGGDRSHGLEEKPGSAGEGC